MGGMFENTLSRIKHSDLKYQKCKCPFQKFNGDSFKNSSSLLKKNARVNKADYLIKTTLKRQGRINGEEETSENAFALSISESWFSNAAAHSH
jgi:hypothetical protein